MRNSIYKLLANVLTGIGCLLVSVSTSAGDTYSYTLAQQSYLGSQERQYNVYVPDDISNPAPMVMVLHGCDQTHEDVLNDWGMKAKADQEKFILVAPFITEYYEARLENCWGFWLDDHIHEGKGEAEDLYQIALEVESKYNIDPKRRYITGLSSGGAMSVIAATTQNEYWAAAATASGQAYSETEKSVNLGCGSSTALFKRVNELVDAMKEEVDDSYAIPMLVLKSKNDCLIVSPADNNIRDAHLGTFGIFGGAKAQDIACEFFNGNNFDCLHTFYTKDGTISSRSTVEVISFNGPVNTDSLEDNDYGHYWVGGANGNEGKYAVKEGPSYPDLVWDFFNRHPREEYPQEYPVVTLNGTNPFISKVNNTLSVPGASATDQQDGVLSVSEDCSGVDVSTIGEYSCAYTAVDSDENSVTIARQVIVKDLSCIQIEASPFTHWLEDRVVAGGYFNMYVITADYENIGWWWDMFSSVTLTEGEPGSWYSQPPMGCNAA